jgi:hypothetical protein
VKIGNFKRKSHTKITLAQSTKITLMTAADFGNKQVVSNQLNSTISGVIMVPQHMYLGHKGNAELLLKNFQV